LSELAGIKLERTLKNFISKGIVVIIITFTGGCAVKDKLCTSLCGVNLGNEMQKVSASGDQPANINASADSSIEGSLPSLTNSWNTEFSLHITVPREVYLKAQAACAVRKHDEAFMTEIKIKKDVATGEFSCRGASR